MERQTSSRVDSSVEAWNAAVCDAGGSFLQSYEWGEFQTRFGHAAQRIRSGRFSGQYIRMPLPLGKSYWYLPRGPLIRENADDADIQEFFRASQSLAKKSGAIFLRIEPSSSTIATQLIDFGGRDTGRSVQPRKNLVIDLDGDAEALLARMHHKARYNIGLASRHGVVVEALEHFSEKDFDASIRLLQETAERQHITIHPRRYYELMFETLCVSPDAARSSLRGTLYCARYRGEPIATAFTVSFCNRTTYLHGGTSLTYKEVMAPYCMHWTMMQDARRKGLREYDFGGIDEARWPGLTRFKKGFGGREELFPSAHDIVLDAPWYAFYSLARGIRRG